MKWTPPDIIALIVIIGAIILLIKGIDNIISFTLLGVVGAYYGIDLTPFIRLGRNQKKKE